MPSIDGLPESIAEAVVTRLRDKLQLQESACFKSLDWESEPPNPSDVWYVVSPFPRGSFDQGMFDGGGLNQATLTGTIIVTIHVANSASQADHDDLALSLRPNGVFVLMRSVLQALCDPTDPLTDGAGNELLRQPLFPQDYEIVRPSGGHYAVQIGLSAMFDWNLA